MQLTSIGSSPDTSCTLIGPGSEKTWNFAEYPDDPKGKWDELAKHVADVYLVMYQSRVHLERRHEKRRSKREFPRR